MFTYRLHHRWVTTLIFALLAVALSLSALSAQVRANASPPIPDNSVLDDHNTNRSMSLLDLPSPSATVTPPPTSTPSPVATATATLTNTPRPTSSPTRSGSFDCSLLSLSNKRLFGNQFRIDIQNDTNYSTVISRVQIEWPNILPFAQTGLAQMSLNDVAMWNGPDPQVTSSGTTTTDTNIKPGNPPFLSTPSSTRTLPNNTTSTYAATFNGPPLLSTYVIYYQYAVTFTIDNPLTPNSPCVLTSLPMAPTPPPTGQPTPTFTPTPNCGSSLITIKFNSFDNFGIVRFDILNQRNVTSTLKAFTIHWQKYVRSQRLRKVSMLAPPGIAGSIVIWDAGNVSEDAAPPTNSQTEGTWLTDFTIPPGALGSASVTSIYFDFDGIYRYDDYYASRNPHYGGSSDFNFSEFALTCGTTGGGQPTSKITPQVVPTPTYFPTTPAPADAAPERNIYTNTHTPTLTWTEVTWADAYQIQISTDINFASGVITALVPAGVLSYKTEYLVNNTYYWRVMALEPKSNIGTWSTVDSFVIDAPP